MEYANKSGGTTSKRFFPDFTDRSSGDIMEILLDGSQLNENPAAAYRGFGCVSANNSSRLLLDYKAQHPKEYDEILRLLFQKDYGAGINHIKIELGTDVNSSSGTEPCSMRTLDEDPDVTRGAGFQLIADAKKINPDITVDMLRWGEPGWVTRAFRISQENGLSARYRWYKETLDAAYKTYGIQFDYISADQNETDAPDEAWIMYLRFRLDHEKEPLYDYSKIKIVASDEVGSRQIAEQMVDNSTLRNAVDVIGLHYTTKGDSYTNLLNEAYGKEIWYSEGAAPCNVPELTIQTENGSTLTGKNGAIDIANRIINSYYNGKMVMYEFQPAVSAYYDGACYFPKHLIRANEPWSGHYKIDIGLWMAMHFSRFAQKGWMYVNGACYGDGDEDHSIINTSSNYMTLAAPDRSDFSMFFTNADDTYRNYSVVLKEFPEDTPTTLSTVITKDPVGRQAYDANWFVRGKSIRQQRGKVKKFIIKVPPHSIMTVTTLDTSWVEGVNTFLSLTPTQSERLELPYVDELKYTEKELEAQNCSPRYMTDQSGAFELEETENGTVITQKITPATVPTNWRFRGTPLPLTVFGDDQWHSYSMQAEVRLSDTEAHNFAGIGIHHNSTVTCEFTSMCGYTGRIYGDGSWKLMDMESVAAEGMTQDTNPTEWNTLRLLVLGNAIFFFINGNLMTKYTPQCMIHSGRASLNCNYSQNQYRNIRVEPVEFQYPYVRRIDCFGENIVYDPSWTENSEESYLFYNRTSMSAGEASEFSCTFTGTGIAVIGTAKNTRFSVYLDGKTIYDEFFVPNCMPRQACFILDQLPEGTHQLRVYATGGPFKLDCLEVPEKYYQMPNLLVIPQDMQQEAEEKEYQRITEQKEKSKRQYMYDLLWHMEHPMVEPPATYSDVPLGDAEIVSAPKVRVSQEDADLLDAIFNPKPFVPEDSEQKKESADKTISITMPDLSQPAEASDEMQNMVAKEFENSTAEENISENSTEQ